MSIDSTSSINHCATVTSRPGFADRASARLEAGADRADARFDRVMERTDNRFDRMAQRAEQRGFMQLSEQIAAAGDTLHSNLQTASDQVQNAFDQVIAALTQPAAEPSVDVMA